ncbi:alpha/beta hydrolase [Mycobacterium sp. URHB0044]|uniref:alpha/beta hydrolase n=1 Tax=Mycobacterium sp. URHB0044 TaxID=1380386 RepID=UPI000685A24F|nr:alpha/beta hydrolase [Mycobacterium sp. URHB0044]
MSLNEQAVATSVKVDIEFRADSGVTLRGWVKTPDSEGPHPTIVMSPGFTSSITRLETVADAFVARGFGVLLYDQRTCASSDGEPRQDIDPVAQDRDMQMALSFVERHPALDSDRIGLWGSSFSGASVLVVAAMDRRVKAVVSQVPFISGYEQFVLGSGHGGLAAINHSVNLDRQGRLNGEEPGRVPLVRMPTDPADHPVLFEDRADYEYLVGGPQGPADGWINSVTVRSTGRTLAYDVRPFMRRISPTPLLMVVASDDQTTPPSLALEAYEAALEPKELVMISGGHYAVYWPHLSRDRVTAAAARWFETHLGKATH